MTKEALRKAITHEPFKPFSLNVADGRRLNVPHQDYISMHPRGRTVVVFGHDEDLEILDVMLITGLSLPGKTGRAR